jgi:chemotaxis family two-component system sensor kinase Cph1
VWGCDLEPIHIPGAIQPHGLLIALDPRSLTVLQISANCAAYLGAAPEE